MNAQGPSSRQPRATRGFETSPRLRCSPRLQVPFPAVLLRFLDQELRQETGWPNMARDDLT
eukprot:1902138-Pyramimonas_sp.AAC.1